MTDECIAIGVGMIIVGMLIWSLLKAEDNDDNRRTGG